MGMEVFRLRGGRGDALGAAGQELYGAPQDGSSTRKAGNEFVMGERLDTVPRAIPHKDRGILSIQCKATWRCDSNEKRI